MARKSIGMKTTVDPQTGTLLNLCSDPASSFVGPTPNNALTPSITGAAVVAPIEHQKENTTVYIRRGQAKAIKQIVRSQLHLARWHARYLIVITTQRLNTSTCAATSPVTSRFALALEMEECRIPGPAGCRARLATQVFVKIGTLRV